MIIQPELIYAGLIQGLILGVVALGVMIPFKIVQFPDLTAEGAYPLGGSLSACLIVSGVSPLLATVLATIMAGFLGLGTAFVHLRFKVNTLLAGIILSTMIYSVNLRLMGKPNIALFDFSTLFSGSFNAPIFQSVFLIFINIVIIFLLYQFLNSEKGLRLRAVGLNPLFAQRQGVNLTRYVLLGLFLGNALNGLAGSIMVQIQQYADIGMGVGIVIHALAALMIGESILGTQTLARQVIAPIVGAIIYQQIQGVAMNFGLAPSDLKLMTGAIVLLAISYKYSKTNMGLTS